MAGGGAGAAGAAGAANGVSAACKACWTASCGTEFQACATAGNQNCTNCVNVDWQAGNCANNTEYAALCGCTACDNDCGSFCP
jgi:hypothetical protein